MDYKYIEHELGDVLAGIFSGGTPSTQKIDYWNGDLHWLSSGETRNRMIKETEKMITELGAQNSSTKLAKAGDVVMASAGQGFTRGQTSIIEIDTYINQSLIALRVNPQIIDNKYLFYNLSSRYKELRMLSDSSSIRGSITTNMLKKMKIMLPNIEKQKSISSFLWDLDKKIDINKAIINNLEELSQTLFKRWFVDFEFPNEEGKPYKLNGGNILESESQEIPEGWMLKSLNDLSDIIFTGGTPSRKKEAYWNIHEIPWLKTKEIKNNFILDTEEYISALGLKHSSAKWAKANSIVIAMYGATAGKIGYVVNPMATNQACCVIESKYPNFVWCYLKHHQEQIKSMATGSAQQNLSKNIISNLKIQVPTDNLLKIFESIASPLTELCIILSRENKILRELSNNLLPKLLLGEIEIPKELEAL